MATVSEQRRDNAAGIWRTYRYDLSRGRDIARMVARQCYAWPGAYELFVVTDDGAALCFDCCRTEYGQIARSTRGDGWRVVAYDTAANCEEHTDCDHCGRTIVEGIDDE